MPKTYFCRQACDRLIQAGYDVLRIDCTNKTPDQLAQMICDRLKAFFGAPDQETTHARSW